MLRFELLRQIEKDPFILKCHKCESKPLEILFMQTSIDHRICLCEPCYKEIGEIFNYFKGTKKRKEKFGFIIENASFDGKNHHLTDESRIFKTDINGNKMYEISRKEYLENENENKNTIRKSLRDECVNHFEDIIKNRPEMFNKNEKTNPK